MANINGTEFFVGCDPEVFVYDTHTQQFVSAHGMIPGTKEEPHLVQDGMIQVDGMALEFGIDPSANEDEFVGRINSVVTQLKGLIDSDRYELRFVPTATFSEEVMAAQPPEALELGCEPDFNAYTQTFNATPVAPQGMRSAGGHIHVGWTTGVDSASPKHINTCAALAAQMDFFLGVASLGWDNDNTRRQIYGSAGAFRPKPYGMEYRTLSNAGVADESLIRNVYRRTIRSVSTLLEGDLAFKKRVSLFGGEVNLEARAFIDSELVQYITDAKMLRELTDV